LFSYSLGQARLEWRDTPVLFRGCVNSSNALTSPLIHGEKRETASQYCGLVWLLVNYSLSLSENHPYDKNRVSSVLVNADKFASDRTKESVKLDLLGDHNYVVVT
jgi:hypothetical protein